MKEKNISLQLQGKEQQRATELSEEHFYKEKQGGTMR